MGAQGATTSLKVDGSLGLVMLRYAPICSTPDPLARLHFLLLPIRSEETNVEDSQTINAELEVS